MGNNYSVQTAEATKWSTITEVAAKLVTPVTNMILARLLAPAAFGAVATISVVVSFADIFTDAGFQKFLIQHDFEDDNQLNRYTNVAFWTNLFVSIAIWLTIAVFSNQLATLVGSPGLGLAITISALSLPLTAFSSIQMARYKRDFAYKDLLPIRMVAIFVPLFVTIPLALIYQNFWALIIGTLAGHLANAVLLTMKSSWKPTWYYNFDVLKAMFSYSWWILLETISIWLTTYIGTFIVGSFLSQYYVGIYKTSMTTVNQFMGVITASTSVPLFTALSRVKDNRAELVRTYNNYIQAVSMFVIPLGIGMWLYKDLLVDIMLGDQWQEATDFIGMWSIVYAFSIVYATYCNGLYNAVGKTHLSFASQIAQLVVLVPALVYYAQIDFEHLYIARCVTRLELILVQFVIMKFAIRFPILSLVSKTVPCLVCSSIMSIFAFVLQRIDSSFLWQILSVVLCMCVYFGSMYFLYRKELFDALRTLGIKSRT